MPTYTYECPVCGQRRTEVTSVADRDKGTFFCAFHYPVSVYLNRVPDTPNFTIKGFTAKNGYSK